MIEQLKISNIAIIKDNTLDFETSFTSLLGETGSGKSLIVNSLSLLKGDKADYSLIKDKNQKAFIQACFSLDETYISLHEEIKEYLLDNMIVIKRVLSSDNTSKYFLNDQLVPLSTYKKIISHLIDIHSQGENWELFDENKHIDYLDLFNSDQILKAKKEYQEKYLFLTQKEKELVELENNKEIDVDYISYQIEEIEKYHLKENEIENLTSEYNSLKDYEKLSSAYKKFQDIKYLNEGKIEDILSNLSASLNYFSTSSLSADSEKVKEDISSLISSINKFETDYLSLDINPKRIDEINERLFSLKSLQRKYGNTTNDILNKLKEYKEMIDSVSLFDKKKQDLKDEISKLKDEVIIYGKKLTDIRKNSAVKLENSIVETLKDLNFNDNGFKIAFNSVDPYLNGLEKVSFSVRLNKGMDFLSLSKACSGGEASRLMLALKIVLNRLNPYNLIVLDEIDIGLSGYTATLIGKKIRELSKSSQVILISHLPQVIVFASSFFKVYKEDNDNVTLSYVKKIENDSLVNEIAKMLSLNKVNDEALIQAKKIIDEAKE